MTDYAAEAHVCHDCLAVFLFKSDFEDHTDETGHRNAAAMKIISVVKLGDKNMLLFEAP